VFRLAREERDAWVNWPARVAALMAADLGLASKLGEAMRGGSRRRQMQKVLEAHVRAQLDSLAEVPQGSDEEAFAFDGCG
jgi:hypothetical protein